jgi:hypothetical protein
MKQFKKKMNTEIVAGFIAIIIDVGCWFYRNNYRCWLLVLSQ